MPKSLFLAASLLSFGIATAAFAQSGATNANPPPSAPSAAPSSGTTMHHARTHHAARGANSVRQAQQALQAKGLYQANIDGRYGPKTHQAIMQFQQQNNLKANGRLDHATMVALRGGGGSMGASMGANGGMPSNATSANPNNNAGARSAPSGSSMEPAGSNATPKPNPGASQPAN
jgi:peptidoglycan hydrolase-like protein with peptidoglycan-binding domain